MKTSLSNATALHPQYRLINYLERLAEGGLMISGEMRAVVKPDYLLVEDRDAIVAALLHKPSSVSTEPKLGDIVTMNQESPYFSDWRGIEMKIVSLRLAPDGKLWASVIERPYDQGYRGYGTYDGETTDIDVAYLSALSSACPEAT